MIWSRRRIRDCWIMQIACAVNSCSIAWRTIIRYSCLTWKGTKVCIRVHATCIRRWLFRLGTMQNCAGSLSLVQIQQEINREPLSPTSAGVLRVLYEFIHAHPQDGKCAQQELTIRVNLKLVWLRENFRLNAHEVGRALTSLGFTNRKRTNAGFVSARAGDTKANPQLGARLRNRSGKSIRGRRLRQQLRPLQKPGELKFRFY